VAPAAARRLGLAAGDAVVVESASGRLHGRLRIGPLADGAVMVHWPEANVLLASGRRSPEADTPAYKDGRVRLRRAGDDPGTGAADAVAAP
jgi:anaerobic selenocysteine-containing dehydrogenase